MKIGNKLSIVILVLSLVSIIGSIYYYNETYSNNNTHVVKKDKKKEVKEEFSKQNIEFNTELKEDKYLIVSIKNISGKELIDVLFEIEYNGVKLSDFYIQNFKKDGSKTVEIDINKKSIQESILKIYDLKKDYIYIDEFEFQYNGVKGKVLATSFKNMEFDEYKKIVNDSSIDSTLKENIIKQISEFKDRGKIDEILLEKNIYSKVSINENTIKFSEENKMTIKNSEEKKEEPNDKEKLSSEENSNQVEHNNSDIRAIPPSQPVQPAQPVQPSPPVVGNQPGNNVGEVVNPQPSVPSENIVSPPINQPETNVVAGEGN